MSYPVAKPALKVARRILADALTPIPVSVDVPFPDRPAQFVTCNRVGGGLVSLVTDAARIQVQCWAAGHPDVEDLTNAARAALQNAQGTIVEGAFIRGFDNIEGPVDYPDPEVSDLNRWQFQGDLLVSTS